MFAKTGISEDFVGPEKVHVPLEEEVTFLNYHSHDISSQETCEYPTTFQDHVKFNLVRIIL